MMFVIYVASCVFSYGALNADVQWFYHDLDRRYPLTEPLPYSKWRSRIGMDAFFALIPVINVAVAVFGTGFLQHGWTLAPYKETER